MHLLTHYTYFINLSCSITNFLTVEGDRIYMTLIGFIRYHIYIFFFGVSRAIVLDILKCLSTSLSILLVFFTKLSFILFTVRFFFLLIHFLEVEDYELPKSTSHVLSVLLSLEYVRILFWSICFFFYFNCLPDDVLMILLSTHHITKHLICCNKLR